jgi:hypothetical protein
MRTAYVAALTATLLGCKMDGPMAGGKDASKPGAPGPDTASSTATTTGTDTATLPGAGDVAIQECAAEAATSCGAAVATQLDLVVANVTTIEESFKPGALALQTEGALRLQDGPQENPCAEFEGEGVLTVAKCQPNLLGVYLDIGKMPLTMARKLIPGVSKLIKDELDRPDGKATGRIVFEDEVHGKGLTTIDYEVLGGTNLRFILDNDDDHLFVDIQSTAQYHLAVRMKNSAAGQPDAFDADVAFADKDNWSTTSRVAHDDCPGEGDGPKNIMIHTVRENGLWKGKSMLYDHSGSDICQTKDHPGQTAWFTDYVGDATQMTAAQYYLSMSDDPASFDFDGGGFDTLCVRIPEHHFCGFLQGGNGPGLRHRNARSGVSRELTIQQCMDCGPSGALSGDALACAGVTQPACEALMGGGTSTTISTGTATESLGDPLELFATITNPFCSQKDGPLGFGAACDSPVSAIANAEFLPSSLWLKPKELRDLSLCIPASLSDPKTCAE